MNSALSYIGGILFILLGVAVSIAWHELGHLWPAKKFGVRVTKYMIGFGPTLFSRNKNGTEYGIKAIPLGGYIAMSGMFPPEKNQKRNSIFKRWASEARSQQAAVDGDFDKSQAFYNLPVGKRIIIMLGGPAMNAILGVALMFVALSVIGTQQFSNRLAAVSDCIPAPATPSVCGSADVVSPAKAAGLQANDRILAIDAKPISTWAQVDPILSQSAGKTLVLKIERKGKTQTISVTPIQAPAAIYDPKTQLPSKDAAGNVLTEPKVWLGVRVATERMALPADQTVANIGSTLGQTFGLVANLPKQLYDVATTAFNGESRALDSPVSIVGVGQIAGQVATNENLSWLDKLGSGLLMLSSLNFALFVFNLIPLLPLDGGHVLSGIYEAIKRFSFKLFKRKDPGPVDTAMMVPLTLAMWVVLVAMSVVIIAADIVNPIRLG